MRLRLALLAVVLSATVGTGCVATNRTAALARRTGFGVTIESEDRQLAEALSRLLLDRSADAFVRVAIRYGELGISDKAMDYYSQALARHPGHIAALDGRARIWRDWGFLPDALKDADRAIRLAPDSASAHNTRGTILQAMHRPADAAAEYGLAATLDPKAPHALNNRCYLAFTVGLADLAIRDCAEALRRDASFTPARHNLALIHAARGDTELASAYFGRSSNAIARYNMGIVFLARKDYSRAAAEFEAAARTDPAFTDAHRRARQAAHLVKTETERSHADR